MSTTDLRSDVTYLAEPLARDALKLYLGNEANILPIPTDDEAVEFVREQCEGHTLVLVPMSDRDRTVRSAAALLKQAGLACTVSPISAEWFLSATLPPGKLESLLLGAPRDQCGHVVLNLQEFFDQNIPDAVQMLGPYHEADVCFLAAWRGTGKTLFQLSTAVAMASGMEFLKWHCAEPRKVLYVDGEMPFALLRGPLLSLRVLCEVTGISSLSIHHPRKGQATGRLADDLRGGGALVGAVDLALRVERDENRIKLSATKTRGDQVRDIYARWDVHRDIMGNMSAGRFSAVSPFDIGDASVTLKFEVEKDVLEYLHQNERAASTNEVYKAVGHKKDDVINTLEKLVKDGRIVKTGGIRGSKLFSVI